MKRREHRATERQRGRQAARQSVKTPESLAGTFWDFGCAFANTYPVDGLHPRFQRSVYRIWILNDIKSFTSRSGTTNLQSLVLFSVFGLDQTRKFTRCV